MVYLNVHLNEARRGRRHNDNVMIFFEAMTDVKVENWRPGDLKSPKIGLFLVTPPMPHACPLIGPATVAWGSRVLVDAVFRSHRRVMALKW